MSDLTWDGHWPNTTMALPKPGDRVTYRRKATAQGVMETGDATVIQCWCGMEPMIALDNGVSLAPCCGDTWAVRDE